MTNIGLIGVGFMGYTHFEGVRDVEGGRITAIASRSEKKLAGDWTGIQGNFGPPAGQVDLSGISTYTDYRELLADDSIDLVDLCLPTSLHEQVALEAIDAGKHVLVEKPIAIDPAAADRMVEAAAEKSVLLMVGHVLPFFPEFRFVSDAVSTGEFGKLLAVHLRRVMCPPDWWNSDEFSRQGGYGIDLHIHDNHFICHLCGTPTSVFAGGRLRDGFVEQVHSNYVTESGIAASCVSGGLAKPGLAFAHGYEVYFEQATVLFNAGTVDGEWTIDRPVTVIAADGSVTNPTPPGGGEWYSAFTSELQAAVDSVSSGMVSPILSGLTARDALRLCYAEAESIASGAVVSL